LKERSLEADELERTDARVLDDKARCIVRRFELVALAEEYKYKEATRCEQPCWKFKSCVRPEK
jgi:hypothetical protein